MVSSAGRRGALVKLLRRDLAEAGGGSVVAVDASPLSAAGHLADRFDIVPRCTDRGFIPVMLDICRRHEVALVVPTVDPELGVWADHRDAFAAAGVLVLVSSPETVGVAADKLRTYRWLVDHGLPTVATSAAEEALAHPGRWEFPVIAKPAQGSASIGVRMLADVEDLSRCHDRADLVVQQVAAGVEHTADAWVDRGGNCLEVVLRRRLEVRAGEVSKGVTVRSPAAEKVVREAVEALPGAFGPITVQVFVEGATTTVIEINPRFGGGYPLARQAGARFTRWAIDEAAGRPPSPAEPWRAGLVMLRYDEAVFVDGSEMGLP